MKKINEIFDVLDSDKDGEISWNKIDLSGLSADLVEVFKPLLEELEQIQEPLDREEFSDATVRLYNVSDVIDNFHFNQFFFYRHYPKMTRT